jgi:predicted TIM-barrel fold metal-dependent hydrolase
VVHQNGYMKVPGNGVGVELRIPDRHWGSRDYTLDPFSQHDVFVTPENTLFEGPRRTQSALSVYGQCGGRGGRRQTDPKQELMSSIDPSRTSSMLCTDLQSSGGAIDVHAHFIPAHYRDALHHAGLDRPDNIPGLPDWDLDAQVATMNEVGINKAMLSISSPGVLLPTKAATVALARGVNDAGAALVRDAPERFGLLASLPLPHVEDALDELTRAVDEIHADGVVLATNFAGQYLSDPRFIPLLEQLDRRGVVVLLHPVSPPHYQAVAFGRPTPLVEFAFETTRAVIDLALCGALDRYPRIRWIITHAGAALPVLAHRVAELSTWSRGPEPPVDVLAALRRLHYDLAGTPLPILLPALLALVGSQRLLYGSDMTFTPAAAVGELAAALKRTDLLDAPARTSMLSGAALTLFDQC